MASSTIATWSRRTCTFLRSTKMFPRQYARTFNHHAQLCYSIVLQPLPSIPFDVICNRAARVKRNWKKKRNCYILLNMRARARALVTIWFDYVSFQHNPAGPSLPRNLPDDGRKFWLSGGIYAKLKPRSPSARISFGARVVTKWSISPGVSHSRLTLIVNLVCFVPVVSTCRP